MLGRGRGVKGAGDDCWVAVRDDGVRFARRAGVCGFEDAGVESLRFRNADEESRVVEADEALDRVRGERDQAGAVGAAEFHLEQFAVERRVGEEGAADFLHGDVPCLAIGGAGEDHEPVAGVRPPQREPGD